MKQAILALIGTATMSLCCSAQEGISGVTHSGQLTHQAPFPIETYQELPNPAKTDAALWAKVKGTLLSWGSTDLRYKKEEPAPIKKIQKSLTLTAWRGERVAAQWALWTSQKLNKVECEVSDLTHTGKKASIGKEQIFTGFVRYVMTDELNKDGKGGCGYRPDATQFDSSLVADPIDHLTRKIDLEPQTTQGGWIRVNVPENALPGMYKGQVILKDDEGHTQELTLNVKVLERTLPQPSQWHFHLDLWQNPFAIARYHQVEPWSKKHFEVMKPYMELYRDAGGKVITTSIMHKPWNGQTHDYFETMVTWMKKADGTWFFDYTIFDRWVSFMMKLGINKEIACYSMVPWRLSFQYYDQATNSIREFKSQPGEELYNQVWEQMLKSFAQHLKEKGWFGITHISMDERPAEVMKKTIALIRKADPNFKISLAGALHKELLDDFDDNCVALSMKYTEEMLSKRKAEGKVTTFYTSCEEPYPNTFTFCPPAESEWMGWYAARANLDGYLRWALNSWVLEPLLDSRFHTWAAGDTYLIYPGARTSVRFERLIAGIQAYEKVRILKEEFTQHHQTKKLKKLTDILNQFDEHHLNKIPAARVIGVAQDFVNQ